ncbi:MAG: hypothetical protein M0005_07715 [Actinomycetota bacterium]|nr:hypothetical protein [Actinomycetota bacterium]
MARRFRRRRLAYERTGNQTVESVVLFGVLSVVPGGCRHDCDRAGASAGAWLGLAGGPASCWGRRRRSGRLRTGVVRTGVLPVV